MTDIAASAMNNVDPFGGNMVTSTVVPITATDYSISLGSKGEIVRPPFSFVASAVAGSAILAQQPNAQNIVYGKPPFAHFAAGIGIGGPGIPSGTVVVTSDDNSGQITLSSSATATTSNAAYTTVKTLVLPAYEAAILRGDGLIR